MDEVKFLKADYTSSDATQAQGGKSVEKKLQKRGYHTESRNGYISAYTSARVNVSLSDGDGCAIGPFDVSGDIKRIYGKDRMSKKLCDEFVKDAECGNFVFEVDDGRTFCNVRRKG